MPHSNIRPRTRSLAKRLRREPTDAERILWRGLREKLPLEKGHWRRQVAIGPYVADFAHLGARLIIEVDGSQHAGSAHDQQRDAWLAGDGFAIVRLWNNAITDNLDGCLESIAAILSGRALQGHSAG